MPALLFRIHAPQSVKALVAALVVVSLLIFIIRLYTFRQLLIAGEQTTFSSIKVPLLQLIPRTTIFYPWVLVTAIFAETGFSLIVSLAVLYWGAKYVDKFWGSKEVVKFVLLVGTITNLTTVVVTIVCNIFRGDVDGMDKPLGGGISFYFGFLVIFKQLIPEHNIVLFHGAVNFRVKHVPFALLVLVSFISIVTTSLYPAVPSIASFFVSYFYLRFFQSFVSDPILPITTATGTDDVTSVINGDASDTFKLAEFFPAIFKPFLGVFFDKVYDVAVLAGMVTPFNDESIEQSNLRAQRRFEQANQTQKSVANSVAERRRQVALQVIEDRINKERV